MKFPVLIAIALWATFSAPAAAQDFRYRGWIGARLVDDKANGCAMGLAVRREGGFVVYANAEGAFKVGLASPEWRLEPGKEALAAIVFDDGPPILLKGAAHSANTVLFEPMDFRGEGGLEPLVESARTVRMTYGGAYLRARLGGSSRAIKELRACAAAPLRSESADAPAAADAGAAADPQARAADFSFLRQGMDAAEANKLLLDAGWQAQGETEAATEDLALKALRESGVPAASCSGAPTACQVDYADAYGAALKLTVAGEAPAKLRAWRLNLDGSSPDTRAEPDEPR